MSKADRIKAEISFHEKMFFAALAVVFAIVGWAVTQSASIEIWLLASAILGLLFAVIFGIWNYRQIRQLLEELENA